MNYTHIEYAVGRIKELEAEVRQIESVLKEKKIQLTLAKVRVVGKVSVGLVYNQYKIRAIKFVMDYGKTTLREAKDRVDNRLPFYIEADEALAEELLRNHYSEIIEFVW